MKAKLFESITITTQTMYNLTHTSEPKGRLELLTCAAAKQLLHSDSLRIIKKQLETDIAGFKTGNAIHADLQIRCEIHDEWTNNERLVVYHHHHCTLLPRDIPKPKEVGK